MIIDGNEIEKRAMKEFHLGNRKEGLRIQEEFASKKKEKYHGEIFIYLRISN